MQNSVGVGAGVSVPATSVASSIPSITISRQQNLKIPVIPRLGIASHQTAAVVPSSAGSIFTQKNSLTMSSSIPPVVHTYSRPRILGRGREVNNRAPGKIQPLQTPPTSNNSIVIASTSTTTTEFGKSLLVPSSSPATNHTSTILHSQPINNSSHIITNAPISTNSYFNVIPATATIGIGSPNGDVVNVNHPSILIGASPPSTSPPASRLIVRIPTLSPVAAADSVPVAMPMQIADIQVVDEAEMQNQVVQSVVQVEIDYQTLVALNDIEETSTEQAFNIHNGVPQDIEIDTTPVLQVDLDVQSHSESTDPAKQIAYVMQQDQENQDTQLINFIQLPAEENGGLTDHKEEIGQTMEDSPKLEENQESAQAEDKEKILQVEDIEKFPQVEDLEKFQVEDIEKFEVEDIEKFPQVEDIEKFPLVEDIEKLPQVEDIEKLPQEEDLEKLPQEEDLEKFPQEEDLEKLPQEEDLEKLPQVEDIEKLPKVEDLEKLPQVEDVDKLPQVEDVDGLPQVEGIETLLQEDEHGHSNFENGNELSKEEDAEKYSNEDDVGLLKEEEGGNEELLKEEDVEELLKEVNKEYLQSVEKKELSSSQTVEIEIPQVMEKEEDIEKLPQTEDTELLLRKEDADGHSNQENENGLSQEAEGEEKYSNEDDELLQEDDGKEHVQSVEKKELPQSVEIEIPQEVEKADDIEKLLQIEDTEKLVQEEDNHVHSNYENGNGLTQVEEDVEKYSNENADEILQEEDDKEHLQSVEKKELSYSMEIEMPKEVEKAELRQDILILENISTQDDIEMETSGNELFIDEKSESSSESVPVPESPTANMETLDSVPLSPENVHNNICNRDNDDAETAEAKAIACKLLAANALVSLKSVQESDPQYLVTADSPKAQDTILTSKTLFVCGSPNGGETSVSSTFSNSSAEHKDPLVNTKKIIDLNGFMNATVKLENECHEELANLENETKVIIMGNDATTTTSVIGKPEDVPAEMNHNSESSCYSGDPDPGCIPVEICSDVKVFSISDMNDGELNENNENNYVSDKGVVHGKKRNSVVDTRTAERELHDNSEMETAKALMVLSKEAQLSSVAVAGVSPSDEIDMATENKTQSSNQTEAVKLSPVKSETVSSRKAAKMVNTDSASSSSKSKPPVREKIKNKGTESTSIKQSSEISLIPRIPIADEASNNAEDETDKIVAAKVPENEYEAQVVEPAEPEPANIRVVEQPPAIRCADLLDEPPDEIEIEGKAALQWRNGIGSLPGSNLKFKINELGLMELIVQEVESDNEIADKEDADAEPGADEERQNDEECNIGGRQENIGNERQEFESTENEDSKSERSGSRSPEYYMKPPPRAKFSIMSNMKNSPEIKDECDPDEQIDTCLSCGRFGLKSELTDSKCNPCIKSAKKKVKTLPSPPPSQNQSESTSEENFKVPQKPYVPYRSAYPIIPRNSMASKIKHLTETITTTMTNSAAIVLGIKDKALVDSLSAGIGLSCSKMILESKAQKNAAARKARNSGATRKSIAKDRKKSVELSVGKEMPHLGSPERSSCDEKEGKIGEMPTLKVNEVEFEWAKYLAETKSKAANPRLFRQPAFPPENPFQRNMVLEAIDPQHQSLFCFVVVVETQGYRLRLRFVGFSEIYDFWMNADSLEIFPCGWCEEHNYKVEPPPGVCLPFDWQKYSHIHGYTVAQKELFAILKEEPLSDSGVEVGMKLEAVDIRNQNLVCVATVANVMGDRFLVHFDSWDTLYDYWTDVTSPFIHPVGWCEENNVDLTPPNNFKARFSWESYLRSTKCTAMPAKLFQPLRPVGFKKGTKLECVDKRNPFLVRVATIAEIDGHEFVIHFDNWPSMYDYKVYELSPDIHPVGWCNHTGHALQSPPPLEGEWDGGCKTFGCIGLGNMKGPRYISHNTEKYCPYSTSNYKKEDFLTDRIVVFERNYGPHEKDDKWDNNVKLGKRVPKRPASPKPDVIVGKRKRTSATKTKEEDIKPVVPNLLAYSEPGTSASANGENNSNQSVVLSATSQPLQNTNGAPMLIILPTAVPFAQAPFVTGQQIQPTTVPYNSDFMTEEPVAKRRRLSLTSSESSSAVTTNTEEEAFHSQDQNYHDVSLKKLVEGKDESQVRKWKTKDVVNFVSRIPGCKEAANLLVEHDIDGESFLLLTQDEIIKAMGFKMGPAVKLANAIRLINGNSTKAAK